MREYSVRFERTFTKGVSKGFTKTCYQQHISATAYTALTDAEESGEVITDIHGSYTVSDVEMIACHEVAPV
jgi:hypothetical protein